MYPFQNLSLGFILKIFLKFRKFSSLDLPSPSKTLKIKGPRQLIMNTDSNNLKTKLLLTILTPFPYLFLYIPYRRLRSDYCSPSSFGPANFHDSAVSLTIF